MEYLNKTKEEIVSEYIALKEAYDSLDQYCQKEKANHSKLEFLLNERVKKSSCHNRISEILGNSDYSIEEVLQKIVNIIPDAWQFPAITSAVIQINEKVYHSEKYILTKWSQTKDIVVIGETIGTVNISYQESTCFNPQNPFFKEEDDLLYAIANRLGSFIEKSRINVSLNESELKYRNLIENINEVIYEIDPAGTIVYISPSIEKLIGYKQEELIGKSFLNFVGENADYLSKRYFSLREKGDIKNEYKILSKSGETHWIRFSTKAIMTDGVFTGGTGTLVDITDKKRIEIELQSSEALYKSILSASPDIITITDMEGKIKFSSPKMTEMFGLKQAEDAIGHSIFEYISEKDHQRALENITKMVNGEIPGVDEYEGVRLDGTVFDIEVNGEYIRDPEGHISGLILVSRDISDRKKAEEMIRQSEIRYKIFFDDNNSVMLMIAPETGEIKNANPAACRYYGWTHSEICSMNISQINTLSKEEMKGAMQKAKEENQNHFYFKHRLANSEIRDVEVYSGPIQFGDSTLLYSIVHDISERIRAEESLIRSSRLYEVISHVNQAIVKFKDKNTLLNEVCRIALDYGQFQMVWIGIVDTESQIVKPIMAMGNEDGYLSHIKQISLSDGPEGHGPTATALREGNYFVCNDISTDPHMALWKDEALKRGYYSSIALPIKQFGKIFSAINLYSSIPHFFNEEEIKLLAEVTENISYALESIDIEKERNLAEEKIKDQNDRLSAIIGAIPDKIFITAKDGTCLEYYSSTPNKLVVPDEKIVGMNLRAIFDKETTDLHMMKINECLQSQVGSTFEFSKGSGNMTSFLEVRLEPMNNERVLTFVRDISDKKSKETQIKRLSLAVEQSPVSIVITDLNSDIEYVNPAFEETTGYRSEEVLGKNTRILKSGKTNPSIYKELWKTITRDKEWHGEWINRRKNGEYYWEIISISPIHDESGKVTNYLAVKQDINSRKKSENEIRDLNENLELKIQQRTEQLAETNINLLKEIEERKRAEDEITKARMESERANMAKSEFLSRMSHELRTPMNSILGFAQLLEMGELNPGQKKGVHHIMRSGKHLLDLINEVLDISRIEAGQLSLSLEPIQIKGVIDEMTDLVSRLADERGIKIKLVDSENNMLFLRSDKQRLKQILLNLINNAIKYNRPGGSIFLETLVMPINEAGVTPVRILVRDTGLGIAEEDLPKLFNPFERIGAEKSETEGSGLGLSVVKKLADAMGGKVGVESVKGEGSSFWVELPMSDEPSERNKTRSEMETLDHRLGVKTGTILYIEDNISNIELVEEIIASQRLGLTMITNPNGRMALPLAIKNKPNLILLDLNLPDIHGSEVLRLLQSDENTNNIPVVVISADALPQQIERLMTSGAKRYITKPIDLNLLLKIIDEYVV